MVSSQVRPLFGLVDLRHGLLPWVRADTGLGTGAPWNFLCRAKTSQCAWVVRQQRCLCLPCLQIPLEMFYFVSSSNEKNWAELEMTVSWLFHVLHTNIMKMPKCPQRLNNASLSQAKLWGNACGCFFLKRWSLVYVCVCASRPAKCHFGCSNANAGNGANGLLIFTIKLSQANNDHSPPKQANKT